MMRKEIAGWTRGRAGLVGVLGFWWLVFQTSAAAQDTYKVIDLGTLGGTFGVANFVANNGQAAGGATLTNDVAVRAVLWNHGIKTDLGQLADGGPNSFANVVNEKTQVVGLADTSGLHDNNGFYCPSSLNCHSFLWQNGTMSDLGTLGGNSSQANYINRKGQIVGVSQIQQTDPNDPTAQVNHAYLWQNGIMSDLGTLGGANAFADGINDAGQISGSSDISNVPVASLGAPPHRGFLLDQGVFTVLGTLGGNDSFAFFVNAKTQIIGGSTIANDTHLHGFFWQRGVMTDVAPLPGDTDSIAFGLNDIAQVVGGSQDVNGNMHPFLWQNGVMRDLNTLCVNCSSLGRVIYQLLLAFGINSHGEITGCALQESSREIHAFLLEPIPGTAGPTEAGSAQTPSSLSPDMRDQLHRLIVRVRPELGRLKAGAF